MFRPCMLAIFRLWLNLQSSYTKRVGCSFRVLGVGWGERDLVVVIEPTQRGRRTSKCARYDKWCTEVFFSCPILTKLEFSLHIFEKSSNIKFHKNPSSGSRVVLCGRTDMTLIVAFRNFAKAHKKYLLITALTFRQAAIMTDRINRYGKIQYIDQKNFKWNEI